MLAHAASSSTSPPPTHGTDVNHLHNAPLSPLRDVDAGSLDQVVVRVNGLKTFSSVLLMAVALVGTLMPFSFSSSVSLYTLDAGDLTSADIDSLLDWYNARAGNITSLIESVFAVAVGMILPVALMCLCTNQSLAGRRLLGASSTLVLACTFAVTYLLKNAFSSVNVRQEPAPVVSMVGPADLREDLANVTRPNIYTRWPAATKNPSGNPSTKTLLRSAILPSLHASNVTCSAETQLTVSNHVDFYFAQRPWMSDMLSVAPTTELSDVITMQLINDTKSSSALMAAPPMGFAAAQELLAFGVLDLQLLFFHGASASTSPRLQSIDKFHRDAANATWQALQLNAFNNFSRADATLQFSRTQLGNSFCFDAVTFELPTGPHFFPGNVSESDRIVHNSPPGVLLPVDESQCGWDGCLLTTGLFSGVPSMPAQVHGMALCAATSGGYDASPFSVNVSETMNPTGGFFNCTVSNTSMLVVSVAKQVQADGIYSTLAGFGVHKPSSTYKVSVGILSWNLSDVAATFGSKCVDGKRDSKPRGCKGIFYELNKADKGTRRFAVLGEQELGLTSRFSKGMNYELSGAHIVNGPLAVARTNGATETGVPLDDYLFLENVNESAQFVAASMNDIKFEGSRYRCSKTAERCIERVRRNHFYAEEPLQQAYTAAMFWLFQNATLRSALNQQSATAASMPQLDFNASVRRISLKASVPQFSAIMTLVGVFIVVLSALIVMVTGKSRAPVIQSKFTPALLAEAMLATGQFPRGVVDLTVTWNKEHVNLSEYKIKSLVLEATDGREVVVNHHGDIQSVTDQLGKNNAQILA